MRSRLLSAGTAALLAAVVASFSMPAGPTHARSVALRYVDMVNASGGNPFAFKPVTITIKVGTKVVWRNKTVAPHTVTAIGTAFAGVKSSISQGQQTSYVFRHVGKFRYYCTYHPYMKATVVVQK